MYQSNKNIGNIKKYLQRLYQLNSIPSLLHPVDLDSAIHVRKSFWRGGTPGFEDCWHIAPNWSDNKLPDEHTFVVIPTHIDKDAQYPVIKCGKTKIAQLEVKKDAELLITEQARLWINGQNHHSMGIINLGTIINQGVLNIQQTTLFAMHNLGLFVNEQELSVDRIIAEGIKESDDSVFVNCGEIIETLVRE